MDEINKLPEDQNDEAIKEQTVSEPEKTKENRPAASFFATKMPIIIGSAIATVAIVVAVIVGCRSHKHNFGDWNIVDEPTCFAAGIEERVCDCNVKDMRRVDALGHKYDNQYDDDCNVCGYTREAEHCTHIETRIIPVVAATCTETGFTEGIICLDCNKVIKVPETVSVFSHDWKEATCTEPKTCQRAGCEATDGEANGHSFGTWVTIKEATTANEGLKERTCHCGEKESGIIPRAYSSGLEFALNDDEESYSVTGLGDCTDVGINIPDTYNGLPVTSIGDSAFEWCDNLTSVVIPDGVTSIGDSAFYRCYGLTSIEIPDSVAFIGEYAFQNCTGLTSVIIGDGVIYISDNAFYECIKLNSVVIPEGVTYIGNSAFEWCENLTSAVIPNSVTSIGNSAFRYCNSLNTIKFEGTVEQWNALDFGSKWNHNTAVTEVICSDGVVPLN